MLGIGYYLKIENINSQQENQSVLIAKICSRKIQKNRTSAKKKRPQKFRAIRYFLSERLLLLKALLEENEQSDILREHSKRFNTINVLLHARWN